MKLGDSLLADDGLADLEEAGELVVTDSGGADAAAPSTARPLKKVALVAVLISIVSFVLFVTSAALPDWSVLASVRGVREEFGPFRQCITVTDGGLAGSYAPCESQADGSEPTFIAPSRVTVCKAWVDVESASRAISVYDFDKKTTTSCKSPEAPVTPAPAPSLYPTAAPTPAKRSYFDEHLSENGNVLTQMLLCGGVVVMAGIAHALATLSTVAFTTILFIETWADAAYHILSMMQCGFLLMSCIFQGMGILFWVLGPGWFFIYSGSTVGPSLLLAVAVFAINAGLWVWSVRHATLKVGGVGGSEEGLIETIQAMARGIAAGGGQ